MPLSRSVWLAVGGGVCSHRWLLSPGQSVGGFVQGLSVPGGLARMAHLLVSGWLSKDARRVGSLGRFGKDVQAGA